jgi:hypothetical protein
MGGMGMTPSDRWAISLCQHHQREHRAEASDPQPYAGDIVVVDGKIKGAQKQTFQALPLLYVFKPF